MSLFAPGGGTLPLEAAAAVRSAAQAVDRLRSHGTQGRGMSAGARDVLVRLSAATRSGLATGEIAHAGGVSSRNVTGVVDTLERDQLVRRVQDPHDRRSVRGQINLCLRLVGNQRRIEQYLSTERPDQPPP
ncbi:MarR family transcriptional regulator [Streptacidiphilus sp. P02-A3a]|uniref:MarR family transcriptional regulator n=1 Tax=Streptacidiphilus sp. P02-A3a TaxID=2704468 RepID=UPI0015FBE32C|nr:MarR family transcriptional regulator [Streptacidiphilus sp. P02-A3a]QMU70151.1 MarR family transcriptional regulator [Streptacidiphilus sp. P02-A3a]QMU70399.1 MarR family transcriptional regulator [Streptacidiphilus sp. P02-A3a]